MEPVIKTGPMDEIRITKETKQFSSSGLFQGLFTLQIDTSKHRNVTLLNHLTNAGRSYFFASRLSNLWQTWTRSCKASSTQCSRRSDQLPFVYVFFNNFIYFLVLKPRACWDLGVEYVAINDSPPRGSKSKFNGLLTISINCYNAIYNYTSST